MSQLQLRNRSKARSERIDGWNQWKEKYEEKINILETAWKELEDGHEELQKVKDKLQDDNGCTEVSDDDILDINAGGEVISVKRGTLTQIQGSGLEALFSGRWDKKFSRDVRGRIFLDVNPTFFKCIVDYLNERKISPPDDLPNHPRVVDPGNAVFFNNMLIAFGFYDYSTILKDPKLIDKIYEYLKEDNIQGRLKLLYRATSDEWDPSKFYTRYNIHGPTLSILKPPGDENILGIFSELPLSSREAWEECKNNEKSFVFLLCLKDGLEADRERLNMCNDKCFESLFIMNNEDIVMNNEDICGEFEVFSLDELVEGKAHMPLSRHLDTISGCQGRDPT